MRTVAIALAIVIVALAGVGSARADAPGATPPKPASKSKHGGFVDDMDCSACHSPDGWKLGAKAGASGFDHDRTGFPLRAAHVQASCAGCHASGAKPPTTCNGCHKDPHQGRQGAACAECHQPTAWADTQTLAQHRTTRMPLTGRHATVECTACHKRQAERTWRDVPVDCYACHRAEYHRGDVHPTHDGRDGQVAFPRDCGLCHQPTGWSPALTDPFALPRTAARRDHDAVFAISTGSHAAAECAACHVDRARTAAVRCDGCHLDARLRTQHLSATARAGGLVSSRVATGCLRCHPRGARR